MSQEILRNFGVYVSAPFQSKLVVDQTALVGDDVLPSEDKFATLLCTHLERVGPELACVERCKVEYEEGAARFEGGGGGLMTGPESLLRIELKGSFVLDKARPWGELESRFQELPRLEEVSLSFHEYGIGILSGWLRVRLTEPLQADRVKSLLDELETRTRDNPELLDALRQCDRVVAAAGSGILREKGRAGLVFEADRRGGDDSARPLWIHLVSIFGGRVGDDLDDPLDAGLTRRFAIVGDAEGFVNMCPSTPWFVHIGWLRSVLVAPDEFEPARPVEAVIRDTQRPLPDTDAGMILRVLRRHQVDWMAGDALNGFLARKLEEFAAAHERDRVDARMEWIERAAVEIELCEAQRSLYLQMLRPVPHQAYQRAMQIRRIQDQTAGYERKLGSLQMLYEQNQDRAEARERRSADLERLAEKEERADEAAHDRRINFLTGMIALLAVISAAADAVMIYVWGYQETAEPPKLPAHLPLVGGQELSDILLFTAFAVIAIGALLIVRSLRRERSRTRGA